MTAEPDTPILVVEPDPTARKALEKALAALGHPHVVAVGDIKSAWAEIKSRKIRLVLCELVMGKQLSLPLLKMVRSTNGYKSLPFVMMARTKNPGHITAVVKAGATDFLVKPFNAKALAEKITKATERKPPTSPKQIQERKLIMAGTQLLKQFNLPKAVAVFTQAIKLNPQAADAYRGLAEICKKKNDLGQFQKLAQKACDLFVHADRMEDAEALFLDQRKYDKQAPNPFTEAGKDLLEKGDPKTAAKALAKAALITPDEPGIFSALAEASFKAGDAKAAEESARTALDLDPDSKIGRQVFREVTGKKWTQSNQYKKKMGIEDEEDEKREAVRFWVPDLLLKVKGHKQHYPLVEMSVGSFAFTPLEDSFTQDEKLRFDIVRMKEDKADPEIKKLLGVVNRINPEKIGCTFKDMTEEQADLVCKLITSVQKQQQEEAREKVKNIDFNIDMLFM